MCVSFKVAKFLTDHNYYKSCQYYYSLTGELRNAISGSIPVEFYPAPSVEEVVDWLMQNAEFGQNIRMNVSIDTKGVKIIVYITKGNDVEDFPLPIETGISKAYNAALETIASVIG